MMRSFYGLRASGAPENQRRKKVTRAVIAPLCLAALALSVLLVMHPASAMGVTSDRVTTSPTLNIGSFSNLHGPGGFTVGVFNNSNKINYGSINDGGDRVGYRITAHGVPSTQFFIYCMDEPRSAAWGRTSVSAYVPTTTAERSAALAAALGESSTSGLTLAEFNMLMGFSGNTGDLREVTELGRRSLMA
jgi:hypothetical protein